MCCNFYFDEMKISHLLKKKKIVEGGPNHEIEIGFEIYVEHQIEKKTS